MDLTAFISIHAPAKGATLYFGYCSCSFGISIHAPAKGATSPQGMFTTNYFISIHAPAKGATWFLFLRMFLLLYFNPRSREGSDSPQGMFTTNYFISIHAPAKGATMTGILWRFLFLHFNPRSREGSDLALRLISIRPSRFQSTLPRRERRLGDFYYAFSACISIHAPAKGATHPNNHTHDHPNISIHAPAKGATQVDFR